MDRSTLSPATAWTLHLWKTVLLGISPRPILMLLLLQLLLLLLLLLLLRMLLLVVVPGPLGVGPMVTVTTPVCTIAAAIAAIGHVAIGVVVVVVVMVVGGTIRIVVVMLWPSPSSIVAFAEVPILAVLSGRSVDSGGGERRLIRLGWGCGPISPSPLSKPGRGHEVGDVVQVAVHVETIGRAAGRMTIGAEHVHAVHEIGGHFRLAVVLDGDLLLPVVHSLGSLQQLVNVNGASFVVIILQHGAVCRFQVSKSATPKSLSVKQASCQSSFTRVPVTKNKNLALFMFFFLTTQNQSV